ncbi:MAG: hypothetical protein RBU30_23965, partial [Polyangia bacterium]|nr:hypothetical protein [Polyangia bacterium]
MLALLPSLLLGLAAPASGAPAAGGKRAGAPRATKGLRLLERAKGRFGPVFVVEQGGQRALRLGSPSAEDQSAYVPAAPGKEPLPYLSLALHALAWAGTPRTVLV